MPRLERPRQSTAVTRGRSCFTTWSRGDHLPENPNPLPLSRWTRPARRAQPDARPAAKSRGRRRSSLRAMRGVSPDVEPEVQTVVMDTSRACPRRSLRTSPIRKRASRARRHIACTLNPRSGTVWERSRAVLSTGRENARFAMGPVEGRWTEWTTRPGRWRADRSRSSLPEARGWRRTIVHTRTRSSGRE